MAEHDEANDAATRLGAALERIAASARRPATPQADTARIAARLDALIAQLRAALGSAAAP